MTTKLLTIFTRTPLHVGAGSSVGAVDQPIIRERHTHYPVIPGSSLKGVLADLFIGEKETHDRLFGTVDHVGSLFVGESKILAFPVRSAAGCFAYVTCPLALERFNRDTGFGIPVPSIPTTESVALPKDTILRIDEKVIFEEYPLSVVPWELGNECRLKDLSRDVAWTGECSNGQCAKLEEFGKRSAVISDTLFKYFVENACEIANHNVIDDETGVVKNFFNQENIPSETMFYCVLNSKHGDDFTVIDTKLKENKYLLQIGADITTGLGWCSVKLQGNYSV